MPHIVATSKAFPTHYHSQQEMSAALRAEWLNKGLDVSIFDRLQKAVSVEGRFLALPMSEYYHLNGFADSNLAWQKVALDLGEQVISDLLKKAAIQPEEIQMLMSTTVTGVSVPSLDAKLMNRIDFAPDLKRIPLFGLGCLAGTAGVARVADYLKGHSQEAAILISVELCSLTLQAEDLSVANIISSGLFGDGAAAVLMVGDEHPILNRKNHFPSSKSENKEIPKNRIRPEFVASQSIFFPDSEQVMGWDVTDSGLKIVLSQGVPGYAAQLRPHVDQFLEKQNLSIPDIDEWFMHPGGPKVIDTIEEGLELPAQTLDKTRQHLRKVGNLSSTSVMVLLDDYLSQTELNTEEGEPPRLGVMLSMGPAFCAEIVLLKW